MAITVVRDLDNPIAYIKNVVAYHLNTDAGKECRARIFIEKVPYSGTYDFILEIKAFPDADGNAYIYLGEELERDILNYDKPSLIEDVVPASEVLKRIKAEFYEYSEDDLEFIDEAYQISSASEVVDIYPLENGEDYIIIAEAESLSAAPEFTLDGGSAKSATLLYQLGDERWYSLAASADYNEVVVEKGVKLIIYKGAAPTLVNSQPVRFVLLGGKSTMSHGFLSVISPKLTNVAFNAPSNEFSLEADLESVEDHNQNSKDILQADKIRFQAQYSIDEGEWKVFFYDRAASLFSQYKNIPGFDPSSVKQVGFRVRAYAEKNLKQIRVGKWEYITYSAFHELQFGGQKITFGGKTIKFQ